MRFPLFGMTEMGLLDYTNGKVTVMKSMNSVSTIFTPQPLRAVGVLFSPMVSGWAGGWREKVYLGCISKTVRFRKLILGRDIG